MKIEKTITKLKTDASLLKDLATLIEQSRKQVAVAANSGVTLLFWQVGKRINEHILQNKRAEYGKQIVPTVSTQLENKYGRNFAEKNVRRMMQFADQFEDFEIVVPLARQLTWSHIIILLPLKSKEAKLFYAKSSAENLWGKRELRYQISRKALNAPKLPILNSPNTKTFPLIPLRTLTYSIFFS